MIGSSHSLYARIILVIAVAFGAGFVVLGAAAWFYARIAADDAYDRLLVGAALQIAESVHAEDEAISVDPPVSAFETLSLSANDRIFYKVVDPRGSILTGYDDLRPPTSFSGTNMPSVSDGYYRTFPVRVAVVNRLLSDLPAPGWVQVVVAQTREARTNLAHDLTLKALTLVAAMIGLAFMSVLFAVQRALEPLTRMEQELRYRDPKDLTPLSLTTPREIETFVVTINRFMDRLSGRIALMQRFIADAAHQIRTPLAALASQVDLLTEETRPERREQQILRIKERASELGRLTNQLLNHAMIIHRAEVAEFDTVDLGALARQVLINAVPLSYDREVSIGYDEPPEPVMMTGDIVSLREALANLIDNALKHGAETRLAVRVFADGDAAVVEVIDDGPGIPVSAWQRVQEPFHAKSAIGSGLGLSIASDVVRAHGGEFRFRERAEDEFAVTMRFKRLQDGPRQSKGAESS